MGASGKTIAIDAAGATTVQPNTGRKHFNVRRFELSVDDGEQQNEQDKVDRDHAMIGMTELRCGFRTR